jgi:hypothetical protein
MRREISHKIHIVLVMFDYDFLRHVVAVVSQPLLVWLLVKPVILDLNEVQILQTLKASKLVGADSVRIITLNSSAQPPQIKLAFRMFPGGAHSPSTMREFRVAIKFCGTPGFLGSATHVN